MPPLPIDVSNALKKVGSTLIVSKMKNSSNKNKKCTLIVGAIMKLIELLNWSPSSSGAADEVAAMLMHQMECINKSMDKLGWWDEKERRKEHKWCKK